MTNKDKLIESQNKLKELLELLKEMKTKLTLAENEAVKAYKDALEEYHNSYKKSIEVFYDFFKNDPKAIQDLENFNEYFDKKQHDYSKRLEDLLMRINNHDYTKL
jgi:organic radical activating enzyme